MQPLKPVPRQRGPGLLRSTARPRQPASTSATLVPVNIGDRAISWPRLIASTGQKSLF